MTNVDLKALAERVGSDWVSGPYYDEAEAAFASQWSHLLWPIVQGSDFSYTLEIAAGHGRNTAKLLSLADKVYAADINATNIAFLRERFGDEPKLQLIQNNGYEIKEIADASITFVYCFDAMVHFYPDVVRAYIKEFRRVMKPGARGFVHYSNNHADKTADYRDHPGWRNYMSREIFEGWLAEEGLRVIKSYYLKGMSWFIPEDDGNCDAMTLFDLPVSPPRS